MFGGIVELLTSSQTTFLWFTWAIYSESKLLLFGLVAIVISDHGPGRDDDIIS